MERNSTSRWRDIPIVRISSRQNEENNRFTLLNTPSKPVEKAKSKKVSWNSNLLEVKEISPRVNMNMFSYPTSNNNNINQTKDSHCCNHFVCGVGQPCRLNNQNQKNNNTKNNGPVHMKKAKLNCSPQLQKVVFRAVNQDRTENPTHNWNARRENLKLNIPERNSNLRGTFVWFLNLENLCTIYLNIIMFMLLHFIKIFPFFPLKFTGSSDVAIPYIILFNRGQPPPTTITV